MCLVALGACTAHAGTASGTILINATVLSSSNCRFTTVPPAAINFGVIDQTRTSAISLTVPAQFACRGPAATATYAVTVNNGNHSNGSTRQMQDVTGAQNFLAYTASVSPATGSVGKNVPVDVGITATIPVLAFQQAVEAVYSDTIIVTVQP